MDIDSQLSEVDRDLIQEESILDRTYQNSKFVGSLRKVASKLLTDEDYNGESID